MRYANLTSAGDVRWAGADAKCNLPAWLAARRPAARLAWRLQGWTYILRSARAGRRRRQRCAAAFIHSSTVCQPAAIACLQSWNNARLGAPAKAETSYIAFTANAITFYNGCFAKPQELRSGTAGLAHCIFRPQHPPLLPDTRMSRTRGGRTAGSTHADGDDTGTTAGDAPHQHYPPPLLLLRFRAPPRADIAPLLCAAAAGARAAFARRSCWCAPRAPSSMSGA